MRSPPPAKPVFGLYVKVEPRVRSPKLWGWAIQREGNDVVVEVSNARFRHADDAWKAGQIALSKHAPKLRSEQIDGEAGQDLEEPEDLELA